MGELVPAACVGNETLKSLQLALVDVMSLLHMENVAKVVNRTCLRMAFV